MENYMKNIIAGVGLALAIAVVALALRERGDRKAPEIQFPDAETVYEAGGDTAVLLEGVKAVDQKDGDVSYSLVIESVVARNDGETAVVSYVASDSSNNVTKVYRTVKLRKKPTEPPGSNPDGTDVQFPDEVR